MVALLLYDGGGIDDEVRVRRQRVQRQYSVASTFTTSEF